MLVAASVLASCADLPPTSVPSLEALRLQRFESLRTNYPGSILKRDAPSPYTWIFIESDGAPFGSWPSTKPSPPTILRSVALSLARKVTNDRVLYLARPCQFLRQTPPPGQCLDPIQWTRGRYSERQVTLVEDAIRRTLGPVKTRLVVVGHSGGGVIALRLAQRRRLPIHCTVTLASPIDIRAWQQHTNLTLDVTDPADLAATSTGLRAIFFFGSRDRTVPTSAIGRWSSVADRSETVHTITIHASHTQGWDDTLDTIDTEQCAPTRSGQS